MPAAAHREPQVVCIWGPEGSGKTTAIYELSRAARLNGFVPVCVRLIASPLASVLAGRTVCVIDDEQATWRRGLVHVSIRSPHPHVVLCTSPEDPRGVPGVRLTALSPPALLAAVRPAQLATDPRIRKAAERADGVPGRFGRYVRGTHYDQVRQRMFVTTAAERAPIYGVVDAASSDDGARDAVPRARCAGGLRPQASGDGGTRTTRRGTARTGRSRTATDHWRACATRRLGRRGRRITGTGSIVVEKRTGARGQGAGRRRADVLPANLGR